MSERRMFAKTIIDSDAFLDMPLSAQALYFHLSMMADDDGFVNSPKKIQKVVGCVDDDLVLLIDKNFIIPFESGVVVIKHWKIHNYIQSDRYKPTVYQEERKCLEIKKNREYTITKNIGEHTDSDGINDGSVFNIRSSDGRKTDGHNNTNGTTSEEQQESVDDYFERIWKLYPVKKGKGQISKTRKMKLISIGYEQLKRCVERFCDEMKGTEQRFWPHGSTFFNGRYVDYLDENWPPQLEKLENKNVPTEQEEVMDFWSD